MSQTKEKLLEVSIVSTRLGTSETTVRRLIKARELKSRNVGLRKGIRVFESSLIEFEKRREQSVDY